jgi:hypothetical protein
MARVSAQDWLNARDGPGETLQGRPCIGRHAGGQSRDALRVPDPWPPCVEPVRPGDRLRTLHTDMMKDYTT